MQIIIRPEAEDDLAAAFQWYEEQLPGLGAEFLDAAGVCFGRVQERPCSYPRVQRRSR